MLKQQAKQFLEILAPPPLPPNKANIITRPSILPHCHQSSLQYVHHRTSVLPLKKT